MQPFGIPPSGKEASGELIDDLDLSVVGDDVLVVLRIERVGPQKLRHGVDPVAPLGVEEIDLVLLCLHLFLCKGMIVFENAHLRSEVREHEEVPVSRDGHQKIPSFFRQTDLVVLFVDRIVQFIVDFVHPARLVAQVLVLRLQDEFLVRWFGHEL